MNIQVFQHAGRHLSFPGNVDESGSNITGGSPLLLWNVIYVKNH
jgi:hypothetical protein